jgi:hypothetical protein
VLVPFVFGYSVAEITSHVVVSRMIFIGWTIR